MGSSIKTIRYVYDSRGNRKALIDPDGGRFTYTYDAVNRISQLQNPQGDRTSYAYDAAGRRTVKEMANGTRASFSYDPAGNLTGLYNLKSGGTVISSFDYAYDKVGNRTAVLEADGSRVTWSYDDTYQLTGEHRTGTSPYRDTYTYDPSGNRLLKIHDGARTTSTYDAANQLTYSEDVSGRTTYTFDADGNQQVVRAPSGDRTTYVWDYENRMTSAQLPSGIRNTMAYDADGLRVQLEESTGTKKFVWDDQNYLAETDENNDTEVVYTNEPRLYGNLISQRRGSDSHWYHFDAIGSTRQITTGLAQQTDSWTYDAWGIVLSRSGTSLIQALFIGQQYYYDDAQLATTYVRIRYYDPGTASWLSIDPLVAMQALTAYRYAANRPLHLIDPSGREPEALDWWLADLTASQIARLLSRGQELCEVYRRRRAQPPPPESALEDIVFETLACNDAIEWQLSHNPCVRTIYDALTRLCPRFELRCGCCSNPYTGGFWDRSRNPPLLKICTRDDWNQSLAETLYHELVHASQWCADISPPLFGRYPSFSGCSRSLLAEMIAYYYAGQCGRTGSPSSRFESCFLRALASSCGGACSLADVTEATISAAFESFRRVVGTGVRFSGLANGAIEDFSASRCAEDLTSPNLVYPNWGTGSGTCCPTRAL